MKRPLYDALKRQRVALAAVAQEILDAWQQDAEGFDELFGTGGACDALAGAFEGSLTNLKYVDAGGKAATPNFMEGAQAFKWSRTTSTSNRSSGQTSTQTTTATGGS